MTRTVIVIPRRADGGRRDELFDFCRWWLIKYHKNWDIYEGDAPEGPFNRGAAINLGAQQAGDWDYMFVWDGDNICAPRKAEEALRRSIETGLMTYAHDTYCYMSQESSDDILRNREGPWFPRPRIENIKPGYTPYLLHKHISGIQVIPRKVWEDTGGFVEFTGWGSEDSVFAILCNTIGGGVDWVHESTALHFWHPHAQADIKLALIRHNRQKLLQLKRIERMYTRAPRQLINFVNEIRSNSGQEPLNVEM